ncbi:MAG: hypothetical protein H0A75_04980 [Candidatus Methanofishera endochildressiae]|uniref:Uncharacterized protein n=1 Tax=Candidatus Methanofishera endochildressiae TaxID=2738884 RepID=A0A7Z0SDK4_9GAMM|nr:hypothetical protein [Candidatus Methanofishera endochildressiae]
MGENWRSVSVPQAQFVNHKPDLLANYNERDKQLFCQQWQPPGCSGPFTIKKYA